MRLADLNLVAASAPASTPTSNRASSPPDAFAYVLMGLAPMAANCDGLDDAVCALLQEHASFEPSSSQSLLASFAAYLRHPSPVDAPLAAVSNHFHLDPLETLALRLCVAAEHDLLIGHLLSHLQQPLARSRPTIGLLAQAFVPSLPGGSGESATPARAVFMLGQGNAVRCGLLHLCGEDAPLPERQLRVPLPIAFALQTSAPVDLDSDLTASPWPGVTLIGNAACRIRLGATAEATAAKHARHLAISPTSVHPGTSGLLIRCGDPLEAQAAALEICSHLGKRPVLVKSLPSGSTAGPSTTQIGADDPLSGLAPWLFLNDLVPVFSLWLGSGERQPIPSIPGYAGPLLVLTGPEGEFDAGPRPVLDWRLTTPTAAERESLWQNALSGSGGSEQLVAALATRAAFEYRHAAGRIALLAARARQDAQAEDPPSLVTFAHIRAASRRGDVVGLGNLAEHLPDEVEDSALVMTVGLRSELEALALRCRLRERVPCSLGPSLQARYRPAVRALLVGPSGTGKTLAASWLATRLGIPLFRVDLSAITSKYIGETEKNLSQLLARAERSEVLLLFDEADSLFGKRTDISDSNDRFANAQTNYLLQRMETYDGITVLTSNGRSRFDDAFSRRFDAILTFPLPGPEERRELWLTHLGAAHKIPSAQLNVLAAAAELTGGQIRNAVLHAAVAAFVEPSSKTSCDATAAPIRFPHLLTGVVSEYHKLSRQLPNELKLVSPTTTPP